jgi:tetratricopeptide (TPR) repeat protein
MNSVKRTNLNKAMEIGKKGLQVAHETNDTIMLAVIPYNMSIIFVNMGKYDSARIYIQEAIPWYRLCGKEIEILWCQYYLAMTYSYQGFYDTAFNEYQNILQSPHIDENNELYSFVLGELGTLYYHQSLYHKAAEAYSKVRSFFINDTARFITASINLGTVLNAMEMYDSSIIVLQKGLEYAEKSNWILKKAALLTRLSNNWKELGRFNDAVACIDEAIMIREEAEDSLGLSYSYSVKGEILLEKGSYSLANDYFFKSLKIDESLNILDNIAASYCLIGNCLQYQQEHEAALAYFGQAYEIAIKIGAGAEVETALKGSALSWMTLNDAKKAADFMERYVTVHDSILKMDDVGYNEPNTPPSSPKESDKSLKQLLTFLGFSFLICLVILLLYRNRNLKAAIKKNADEKNL